jgi:ligand-binding SRPBCC domain-containing protein
MVLHAQFEAWFPFPVERAFLFFSNPENLPRIMPKASGTRIDRLRLVPPVMPPGTAVAANRGLAGVGSEIAVSFLVWPPLPFRARWVARVTEFEWNHHFADIQVRGPFKSWHHRHEFSAEARDGVSGTVVGDRIEYALGFGIVGEIVQRRFVARELQETFAARQKVLRELLSET